MASRSGTAQWCSSRIRAAALSLGISSRTSHASSSENAWTPPPHLRAELRALLEALFALDAEADQGGHLAAELDRLLLAEVAEVHHLHLARGVLVHGERVDHAHGVALAELLELLDDLAVEVGRSNPSTSS